MAYITDQMNENTHRQFLEFIRHIFKFVSEVIRERERTIDYTNLNENANRIINAISKYENGVLEYEHKLKTEGNTPEVQEMAKKLERECEFQISETHFIRGPKSIQMKKSLEQLLERSNIPYILTAPLTTETGKLTKSFLVIPNDFETRMKFEEVKKQFFEQFKDDLSALCVGARITKDQLDKENIGAAYSVYGNMSPSQVELFETYAQQNGFQFAAQQDLSGNYTIYVPKIIADELGVELEVAKLNAKEGFGSLRTASVFEAQRFGDCKDKAIDATKSNNDMYLISNGTTIKADGIAPVDYALKLTDNGFEFYANGELVEKMDGLDDTEKMQKQLNLHLQQMGQPTYVTEEKFTIFNNPNTPAPMKASILMHPDVETVYTETEKHRRILFDANQRLGDTFNMGEALKGAMIARINNDDKIPDASKQKLINIIENSTFDYEEIEKMFISGDSKEVFGVKDPELASALNSVFEKSAEAISNEIYYIEKTASDLLDEYTFSDDKSISEMLSVLRDSKHLSELLSEAIDKKGVLDNGIITPEQRKNLLNEFFKQANDKFSSTRGTVELAKTPNDIDFEIDSQEPDFSDPTKDPTKDTKDIR